MQTTRDGLPNRQSLIIYQSLLAGFAVLLFGVWRAFHGEWINVVFDGLILLALGCVVYMAHVYKAFERGVSLKFSIIAICLSWLAVIIGGWQHIFWAVPVTSIVFSLLRQRDAFIYSLAYLGNLRTSLEI